MSNSSRFKGMQGKKKVTKATTQNVTAPDAQEAEKMQGIFFNRKRRFGNFVRSKVAQGLVDEGHDDFSAQMIASTLTDEEIDERRKERRIGELGDGSFLQWLIDHKDQILEFIMSIISIFMLFAKDKMQAVKMKMAKSSKESSKAEEDDSSDEEDETSNEEGDA